MVRNVYVRIMGTAITRNINGIGKVKYDEDKTEHVFLGWLAVLYTDDNRWLYTDCYVANSAILIYTVPFEIINFAT